VRTPKHIREARKAKVLEVVSSNRAIPKADMPTSKGFRMSPDPRVSHRFSIHPGRDFFTHNADQVLTDKQRKAKYRVKDNELYDGKLVTNAKADTKCMVKVGVTKPYSFMKIDEETGETKLVKVPSKPRYKELGLP
jgi:hypothetical protein